MAERKKLRSEVLKTLEKVHTKRLERVRALRRAIDDMKSRGVDPESREIKIAEQSILIQGELMDAFLEATLAAANDTDQ